jgi:hypothetical protein
MNATTVRIRDNWRGADRQVVVTGGSKSVSLDVRAVSTSDKLGGSMTPDDARKLAAALTEHADRIDGSKPPATCSHCGAGLVGEDCPNYGYGEVHA